MRDVLMEEIREVGRERESSIAIMVLCRERIVVWKMVWGEVVEGARVCT